MVHNEDEHAQSDNPDREKIINGAKNQIFWLHSRQRRLSPTATAQHTIINAEIDRLNRIATSVGGAYIDPETIGEELLAKSRQVNKRGWINGSGNNRKTRLT